jgi:hypothetical protein
MTRHIWSVVLSEAGLLHVCVSCTIVMTNGEIASVLLCSSYPKVMFVPLMIIDSIAKIWGVHGGDYEECRLLGYKAPVRTSQETHYVSTTESSQLMLCKIWGFHGDDYEECRLLWCGHIVVVVRIKLLLLTLFLARRFLHHVDGCNAYLRNVGSYKIITSQNTAFLKYRCFVKSFCSVYSQKIRRLASSGTWCRVALVRTDVSEVGIASINRVEQIGELGTM